jgi:hypothetical protein
MLNPSVTLMPLASKVRSQSGPTSTEGQGRSICSNWMMLERKDSFATFALVLEGVGDVLEFAGPASLHQFGCPGLKRQSARNIHADSAELPIPRRIPGKKIRTQSDNSTTGLGVPVRQV